LLVQAQAKGKVVSIEEPRAINGWTSNVAEREAPADAIRLFCFPHAGGGASIFRPWLNELGPGVAVYPLQLPGREGRWLEPPVTRMSALIPQLYQALRPVLRPPFAFFGHSMGAFIAFELARQLRREYQPGPAALIVSAARAPQIPDPDPPVHRMAPDELLEHFKRLDSIPQELLDHPEVVSLLLPTLRADMELCETYFYAPEPPLSCSIAAYSGDHDCRAPREHLNAWGSQTGSEFRMRFFPGDHFYFVKEAHEAVNRALQEDLERYCRTAAIPAGLASGTAIERTIAQVWAEVLRTPHIGLDDNFFDLGGNSLLMILAYSKLRQVTSTTLSVLDLFRYPTVRLLAGAIGATQTMGAGVGLFARTPCQVTPDRDS
jgi:surfactin synthase thioesterase subunit